MSKFFGFYLALALLLATPVLAAQPGPSNAIPKQQKNAIKKYVPKKISVHKSSVSKSVPKAAAKTARIDNVGYLLIDLDSGKTLDALREQTPYIPASVSKVPATLAALHILGSHYRFLTLVQTNGSVINGELQGDLVLVGGGDPSLSMAGLMDMALQLRMKGIHSIKGRFLFDESALIPDQNISDEQNEEELYNQGISALSLDSNRIRLNWAINRSGGVITNIVPKLDYLTITLGASSNAGPTLTFLNGNGHEQWRLNPHGKRSGWDWVPIKKPAQYTALVFREFCKTAGLHLPTPEVGRVAPHATTLASHASAPLSDLVDVTLEHSNNLWTELIGMTAASRLTEQPQSSATAAKVLANWMAKQRPEADWSGFHLANSCGLTSASRISPRQMVEILTFANNSLAGGDRVFASLLPISGWKGTLANRFSTPDASLRVWAKTGTILYGKALAGYLFTQQNRRLAFAIFASDFNQRQVFDAKMGHHVSSDIYQGKSWNGQASGLISSLVQKWLNTY